METLKFPHQFRYTAPFFMKRGGFHPICGIAQGKEKNRHFIMGQTKGVGGLNGRKVSHPAASQSLFPSLQHQMGSNDSCINLPGKEPFFQFIDPLLITADRHHKNDRGIKGAGRQFTDLGNGILAFKHINAKRLIIMGCRCHTRGFKDLLQFFRFNRAFTEFPYRITIFGKREKSIRSLLFLSKKEFPVLPP